MHECVSIISYSCSSRVAITSLLTPFCLNSSFKNVAIMSRKAIKAVKQSIMN